MFEAGNVPAAKISPPRFEGSRVKLNAAPPSYSTFDGKQRIQCLWSLALKVDPIVQFGIFPSNHLHDFYGNPSINQNSTLATLQQPQAGSSCSGGSEYTSSYWFPSIVDTNVPTGVVNGVQTYKYRGSASSLVYYSSADGLDKIQPLPQGLKMVVGKMNNTDVNAAKSHWSCAMIAAPYTSRISDSPTIPTCVVGEMLREKIQFNQCLKLQANGKPFLDTNSVDFPVNDHASHLVPQYSGNYGVNPAQNTCPTGYMLIPKVSLIREYKVLSGDTSGYRLVTDASNGSNPGITSHADYFMALKPKWINMIVDNCIKDHNNCEVGLLGQDPSDGIFKAFIQ